MASSSIKEMDGRDVAPIADHIVAGDAPLILRQFVDHWPSVAAARAGDKSIADYLMALDNGSPTTVFSAPPEERGRFFYNSEMNGFNFGTQQVPLSRLLGALIDLADQDNPPALYAGATPTAEAMQDFAASNPLPAPAGGAEPRIWVGNASRIAPHYDMSRNIACVVAGRRRFTLFPPDQIGNLYVGPVDRTPAGQPVSMVDLAAPDLGRFPKFAEALKACQVAELEPGDAILIPPLWWHQVEALSSLNVLVNYWFETSSAAFAAMMHSVLSIRDLPAAERQVWREWFDHYVFDVNAMSAVDHLPVHARGVLGPPSVERDATIRQYIVALLSKG